MLCLSIDVQSRSTPIQLYRGAKSPRLPFKQAGALFVYLIALQVNKAVYLQNKHFLGTRFHAPTY